MNVHTEVYERTNEEGAMLKHNGYADIYLDNSFHVYMCARTARITEGSLSDDGEALPLLSTSQMPSHGTHG